MRGVGRDMAVAEDLFGFTKIKHRHAKYVTFRNGGKKKPTQHQPSSPPKWEIPAREITGSMKSEVSVAPHLWFLIDNPEYAIMAYLKMFGNDNAVFYSIQERRFVEELLALWDSKNARDIDLPYWGMRNREAAQSGRAIEFNRIYRSLERFHYGDADAKPSMLNPPYGGPTQQERGPHVFGKRNTRSPTCVCVGGMKGGCF